MDSSDDIDTTDLPDDPRILVAGLGNLLLQDDGVGVHVVNELQRKPIAGILVVEIGTAVLNSLHLLEWAEQVLVIDAVQAGGRPGTLYLFDVDCAAMPERQLSLHELSLVGALRFIADDKKPRRIVILGVEPAQIDYGMQLTPGVAAVLPRVIREVRRIVAEWRKEERESVPDCR